MIRVAIADDHDRLRQALVFILGRIAGINIVAECSNGREAVELVKKHSPDVMLMDINMEPLNGIQATEKITKAFPSTRIVGMSMHTDISYVNRMLKAGAAGYLTKNSSVDEIVAAIQLTSKGQTYICEEIRTSLS
ncbi:MAG TPA: response regulator transcription factor, partial [Chitinophagaceae bacterium]